MAIAAMVRSLASSSSRSHLTLFLTNRFFSSSSSHPVVFRSSPFAGLGRLRTSPSAFSSPTVRFAALGAFGVNSIRYMARRAGNSAYSLNSGSGGGFSYRPPTGMALLFPGRDYEHWLIVMDKPGGEGVTKQQMIDCYIQTLAKVVGSEEGS